MDESKIIEKLRKKNFQYVISLGFFCSVAQDLEKMGLRDASGPVDWVWSTWRGVNHCMRTQFVDFLEYENMEQSNADNCIYADRKNGIISFHDFSRYKSFDSQYDEVKEKYNRRIQKFYDEIKSPTLFIRYIWDGEYDGSYADELHKIEKDYAGFLEFIRSFNPENEVIFVANDDIHSDILPVFYVKKDKNDVVNRTPLFGNEALRGYLEEMKYPKREANLIQYRKKMRKKIALLQEWL